MLEALYERTLAGDDTAAEAIITALIDPTDAVREFAAWSLIDLLSVDVLTREQVARIAKRLDQTTIDSGTRKSLADSIRRFENRQPQPCPDCGRTDCRRMQMDADDWTRCESDIDLDKADEEAY